MFAGCSIYTCRWPSTTSAADTMPFGQETSHCFKIDMKYSAFNPLLVLSMELIHSTGLLPTRL
jgi:hypothetical protein